MKLAIVVPRYGADVSGGAETLARGLAQHIARRSWAVEVWTTCARSHYTWDNVYLAGCEECEGVTVRRFPITHRQLDQQKELDARLTIQGALTLSEQYAWLESGVHSQPLYEHIARHAGEWNVLVALPYALPLVHYAVWAAATGTMDASSRVIVWPCLHDEPYAYMEPVRLLLESAWGVIFNSPEERQLATQTVGIRPRRSGLLGVGVELPSSPVAPPQETVAALLYVGRLEAGKNLAALYDHVRRYVDEGGRLRLVVIGSGPFTPPAQPAFEQRGFVSEQDKAAACASALALCQPSLNESFSITVMESWLSGRPVLVHEDCAVTREHVRRSRGGLWFHDYGHFAEAIRWLEAHPDLAARMGQNGRRYVQSNYTWPAIAGRFESLIRLWGAA